MFADNEWEIFGWWYNQNSSVSVRRSILGQEKFIQNTTEVKFLSYFDKKFLGAVLQSWFSSVKRNILRKNWKLKSFIFFSFFFRFVKENFSWLWKKVVIEFILWNIVET